MKRMGTWIVDVTETVAYDIASDKGLRVTVNRKSDRHPWAVVLFSTQDPKGTLAVVDWADSAEDGRRKLREAVEALSSSAINSERLADQIVGALQYLTAQGHEADERIHQLIDEIRDRFGLPGEPE